MSGSARISPTAHYTGHVWQRHGLAHPALGSLKGRVLFGATEPLMTLAAPLIGGLTLETMLLRRHLALDAVLDGWIRSGEVGQVVELASGLSGRGLRLAERWADRGLIYVDTDLGAMVATKRARLAGVQRPAGHHVREIDALASDGPTSLLHGLSDVLDPERGVAVVSEGLLNYFDKHQVETLWRSVAGFSRGYARGRYAAELHVVDEVVGMATARAFMAGLSVFVRGRTHLHWDDAERAGDALRSAGFDRVSLVPPERWASATSMPALRRADVMRIVTAEVG